jgi:hypothetical protein
MTASFGGNGGQENGTTSGVAREGGDSGEEAFRQFQRETLQPTFLLLD